MVSLHSCITIRIHGHWFRTLGTSRGIYSVGVPTRGYRPPSESHHKSHVSCIIPSCNLRPLITSSQFSSIDIYTGLDPISFYLFHLSAVLSSSTLQSYGS